MDMFEDICLARQSRLMGPAPWNGRHRRSTSSRLPFCHAKTPFHTLDPQRILHIHWLTLKLKVLHALVLRLMTRQREWSVTVL